jgi:hypothetical protein
MGFLPVMYECDTCDGVYEKDAPNWFTILVKVPTDYEIYKPRFTRHCSEICFLRELGTLGRLYSGALDG